MSSLFLLLALLLSVSSVVLGLAEFRDRIPNGYNVKDSNGLAWPGVGHFRAAGSGTRNRFGEDFAAAGFAWTETLCRQDSDGDGASNGVELGDPNCVWTPGATPSGPVLSHPGFPGDAQGTIDTCKTFVEPVSSHNLTIQFSTPFALPNDEVTTYPRQGFNLTDLVDWVPGQDHFAVRFEVIYGGPVDVVHHVVLYWCELSDLTNGGYTFGGPPIVGGGLCSKGILYAWAIAFCLPSQHALRLFASSPYVLLEVHMNNAQLAPGVQSMPGFLITVVAENSVSPPNSIIETNWLMMGINLNELIIPPGQGYVELTTNFTFPSSPPAYLTMYASFSHMHWLGRKIWVEKRSAQGPPQSLSCNPTYSNEDQEVVPISSPLNVTNGDVVVVHCVFNSSERVNVTTGGEQTADEMCFVFFLFHSNLWNAPIQATNTPIVTLTPQLTTVDCTASASLGGLESNIIPLPSWLLAHVLCAALGFGFFMPLGALFPASRHFRSKYPKGWFRGHRILMGSATLLGATAFGLVVSQRSATTRFTSSHGKMGLALLILCVAQILMGLLHPHLPVDDGRKTASRKVFEWMHPTLGWVIMGCISVQLFWGYDLLYNGYYNQASLLAWKFAHSIGFFVAWAFIMIFLHPPPFLQSRMESVPSANWSDEKQIKVAV